jgi:hypothetical protein
VPKFNPLIVTVPPPDRALLPGAVPVSTGASNVKALTARVPTTAPTVTLAYPLCTFVAAATEQLMAVLLVQADVPQASLLSRIAVAVKPYIPKLNPSIDTAVPPQLAPLLGARKLTTGASNVSIFDANVPTTAPTVTLVYDGATVLAPIVVHWSVVWDDHDEVAHRSAPMLPEGVKE